MTKLSLITWPLWVIFLASGCANLKIRDIPLYWIVGQDGAIEAHLITPGQKLIPKAEWDQKTAASPYVAIDAESFTWLRATMEKACAELKDACPPEKKEQMKAFFKRSEQYAVKRRWRR